MSAELWTQIVGNLLIGAAQTAIALGGKDGAAFARKVQEVLEESGFPMLRRVARELGASAAERLPRRR